MRWSQWWGTSTTGHFILGAELLMLLGTLPDSLSSGFVFATFWAQWNLSSAHNEVMQEKKPTLGTQV